MTSTLEDPPARELEHERIDELEARAEKTDIREGLSLLAAGAAVTAIGLVIEGDEPVGEPEKIATP
jgi:hypothetical protein